MKKTYCIFLILILAAASFAEMAVTTAAMDQYEVASASRASKSMVVWVDSRVGTGNTNIYFQIIDAAGDLLASELPFCTEGSMQYEPTVGAGQKFVGAWVDEREGTSDYEIYARQANDDGSTPLVEFAVTSTNNVKARPSMGNIGDDLMVVFEEVDGGIRKIKGHCLSWSGSLYNPSGSTFEIYSNLYSYYPEIAGGDTDYLVVWADTSATESKILAQRVSTTGTTIGSPVTIATGTGLYKPQHPAVAWDGSKWFVVWDIYVYGSENNVLGRYVNSDGTLSGSLINITLGDDSESYPDVSFDGIGLLVVYQDTRATYANIWSNRITGTSVGADEAISTGSYNQNRPSVTWMSTNHDVFWQDFRSDPRWDVYTSREDQTPWAGPSVLPVRPTDGGASSCPRQEAVLYLHDSDGINTSTIQFSAGGTDYTIASGELSYSNDSLRFTPSSNWPLNVMIECCLNAAEDNTGLDILTPICWQFMIDVTDPTWGTTYPADRDTISAGAPILSIEASDGQSGISTNNMGFQVEGSWYYYGTSSAISWDGSAMYFDCTEEGISFDPFETYHVCAKVRDGAQYCTPNEIETCWDFYTTGNKIYGVVNLFGESDHSGVNVEARYGDSLWTDVTDATGNYSIPGVMEVAGIQVTAYKAGFTNSSVTVDMSAGGSHEENFTLYPVTDLYYSDFESDDGGLEDSLRFDHQNDWEWGVPTSGPGSAHSGSNCWATKLNSNYTDTSQSRLLLGPIDLTGASSPTLSWWQWYSFQEPTSSGWPPSYSWHDGGNVKLWLSFSDSTLLVPDGAYDSEQSQWNQMIPYQDSYADTGNGNYWHQVSVDLSAWEDMTIYISWDFGASYRNNEAGWYIDDVRVSYTDMTSVRSSIRKPDECAISSYPNPFNSTCVIQAPGEIEIYDISGNRITALDCTNGPVLWNGKNLDGRKMPTGIYFARSKDSNNQKAYKIIFMK